MEDTAGLVSAFWDHYRRSHAQGRAERTSADELWWAAEEVDRRVRVDSSDVVALLVALADAAPDDAALAHLGAGPVEDLLRQHGSDVVFDRVEGAAHRNENLRKALRCAWFDDHVPTDVANRLRSFGDPY